MLFRSYGTGAFVMLFLTKPIESNMILVFVVGMLGATILELITGMLIEKVFNVRYWDYTDIKFNYKGHICLSTSIAWGMLSVFLIGFFHKGVEKLISYLSENNLRIITFTITFIIIVDTILSIKAALDIADIIRMMEESKKEAKKEIAKIHKRLDVYVAVAGDVKDGIVDGIERKIHNTGKQIQIKTHGLKDYYKRSMIKGNPKMSSKKFIGTVEEIRAQLLSNRGKNKDNNKEESKENISLNEQEKK